MGGHQPDTDPPPAFEEAVRYALAHLYDPAYRPPKALERATGYASEHRPEAFQAALIRAIEGLRPAPTVPATARSWRIYDILTYRYVRNLTQEETAERVGITTRHLRREQTDAAHVLALRLWEQVGADAGLRAGLGEVAASRAGAASDAQSSDWLSQVKEELLALRTSAPGAVADVGEVLQRATKLGEALASRYGVGLQVEPMRSQLVGAIHPTALEHVLIAAIGRFCRSGAVDRVVIGAERQECEIRVTVTGYPVISSFVPDNSLMQEILAAYGGSLEFRAGQNSQSLRVAVPLLDCTVLVVDDNPDMVHLYRRYVIGTRYHILHTAHGRDVLETVRASAPDIIVLDVMLPDVDGWELLATLHEHPNTRSIPLAVCSVVREEDLALSLGAALHLAKPIQREEFIGALDHLLTQASAIGQTHPGNSGTAC